MTAPTLATLKPCPFCGHDTPEFERMGTPRQSCIVICGNCGARHESGDEGDRCGQSWNERASDRSALAAADAAMPQGEAVPVGVLIRGEGGAWRFSGGDNLLAIYAMPPGEHALYTTPHPAPAAAEPVNTQMLEALKDTTEFIELYSNRWDGFKGKHPFGVYERAKAAITAAEAAHPAPTPQPVQAVPLTDDDLVAITTAYEQGFGHSLRPELGNPYKAERERRAWDLGREVGMSRAVGRRTNLTGGSNG